MPTALPLGFKFCGHTAGIKESGKSDLAIIASDAPAAAVGMFTTNRVQAAPVQLCRSRLPAASIRGIVVNSGNANACTGEQGLRDAEEMASILAKSLACSPRDVLVASTGVIGRPLRIDRIATGVRDAAKRLVADASALDAASKAIMTTDTQPKVAGRSITMDGREVRVLGFAKGAAMIGPNMATMLAFIMTDAIAAVDAMDGMLRAAVDRSFHAIGVEGHTSTNDSVILLANGASGVQPVGSDWAALAAAIGDVCVDLAKAIVADAEGASKFVEIRVAGCKTDKDARAIAKTIAESALVKAAFFGNDPNWGRICSAAGYAGVDFSEAEMSLAVNGVVLYERGQPTRFDAAAESARLKANRNVDVELSIEQGPGKYTFWTCDLSTEYVRLNSDYTT